MKLSYNDYPNEIQIEVPRERKCLITSGTPQEFSTDDLPSTLPARFVGLETKQGVFRDLTLAKYVVEPIFNLRIYGRYNVYGCENYDIESINKLCKLISQPYMHSVRSSTPQDEFVSQNDIDRWPPTACVHLVNANIPAPFQLLQARLQLAGVHTSVA